MAPQDPFSAYDGKEPPRSAPLPEDAWDGGEEALDALAAGFGAGSYDIPGGEEEDAGPAEFGPGGLAEGMGPGPVLAALVHAAVGQDGSGLGALTEDQLLAVIAAARRLESRAAWTQLAATAEFAARRAAGPPGPARFACDELAYELGLTWQAAAEQMAYADAVARRLPLTFAALAAGAIHPVHLRIIEDEVRFLSDADAARADAELATAARSKTWAQLRYAAHRLALKLDPDAARRRREAARREAHVRQFREQSGNAGMIARELPPDEVLASWQHVEQRALELRAAGVPGSLRELRVRAYLDLLQERDSRRAPSGPDLGEPGRPGGRASAGGGPGGADGRAGGGAPGGGPGGADGGCGPAGGGPAGAGPGGPAPHPGAGTGPSLAALVTLTVPLGTVLGQSAVPGEAAGFGLVDAETARDLIAAAARDPRTRWCVTAVRRDGTAAAHACAPGRRGPPPAGGTGPQAAGYPSAFRVRFAPVIRGPCEHSQAEAGYRPSRSLAHLVRARTARCSAPGCGRPAVRCDLDHTVAWEGGGPTCPCNLAPLCRHHHRVKQAEGWSVAQPEPGMLVWRTPAGRSYTTTPTVYCL
ncbi:MAG TPA: DUF222 domain-containing protein [Streptosporangiaceae bacterium]|jgi:hypothetical protein|nr:DUF222 domain-containing protein [Streptosporangiaceae bacterium]